MKTVYKIFLLSLSIAILSCVQDDNIEPPNSIELNFQKTNLDVVSRITNWSVNNDVTNKFNLFNRNNQNIGFDFANSVSYFDDNGKETIIINQTNVSVENESNIALTFINGDNLSQFMVVKTIVVSDTVKKIENYNFDNELIYTTIFDSTSETIYIVLPQESNKTSNRYSRDCEYSCNASWGENTQACLTDAYANHGWVSVWATVQSAFLPQTAAALAAACAYDALTNSCCSDYEPIP